MHIRMDLRNFTSIPSPIRGVDVHGQVQCASPAILDGSEAETPAQVGNAFQTFLIESILRHRNPRSDHLLCMPS